MSDSALDGTQGHSMNTQEEKLLLKKFVSFLKNKFFASVKATNSCLS